MPIARYLVETAESEDGAVSFIWDDFLGNYVYLEVGPGITAHLFYEKAHKFQWEGVSILGDPALNKQISLAFSSWN